MTTFLELGHHQKRQMVPGDRMFSAARDLLIILSAGHMSPTRIEIAIITDAKTNAKELPNVVHRTSGLHGIMAQIIAPIFLMFFERYNDWLNVNKGDAKNWPPTLNFARVVRNGVAHGKINIRNPEASPVTWRGLTYSYADNGKQIIGTDLKLGEMIVLMFDANDALDAINAPIL